MNLDCFCTLTPGTFAYQPDQKRKKVKVKLSPYLTKHHAMKS